MDSTERKAAQSVLRRSFSRFVCDKKSRKAARARTIRRIVDEGLDACIFGGAIRDIVVRGPSTRTRDIDIVVADVETERLEKLFGDDVVRRTRFGGLNICVEGWDFDIWPLHQTWAFKDFPLRGRQFRDLPKTTFLTVESIVMPLSAANGLPRRIYHSGFFESISKRVVELNLADNPYPALCVVRAFVAARRLRFGIGPKLAKYIAETSETIQPGDMRRAQLRHYRQLLFSTAELQSLIRLIKDGIKSDASRPVPLPFPVQLEFSWAEVNPIECVALEMACDDKAEIV